MRDDPIISGGVFKVALVVLVAGGLGLGGYVLSGGDIGIDLPDLPEIDTGPTTNLSDTELSDTTIDVAIPDEPVAPASPVNPVVATSDPFSTKGFAAALGAVREQAGPGARLTRLFINDVQTQFTVLTNGNKAEAYSVRADTGEISRQDATITITGNAKLDDFAFGFAAVKPAAVDRIVDAARRDSGKSDFRPSVLSLERRIPFGSRELNWILNAQAGARNLVYRAGPDGRGLENVGGAGSPIPPAAIEAQKLNDCIQAAQNNPDEIFACLDRFQ